jgi:hypothetical protein
VGIDFLFHQTTVPGAVVDEPLPYYLLKFVIIYGVALFVLSIQKGLASGPLGPVFIGVAAAILFGIAYYFVEFVPIGQRDISLRFYWGVLHYLFIATAAGAVLGRWRFVLFYVVFIAIAVGLGFLIFGSLPIAPTGPTGPGY